MPMLIRTGKCPPSSGRKTSALSLAPSRMGRSTSFSILIRYWGSDVLVALLVATCSCTGRLHCLAQGRYQSARPAATQRPRPDVSRRAPDFARGLDHEAQLGDLGRHIHGVSTDAAGKSALRA